MQSLQLESKYDDSFCIDTKTNTCSHTKPTTFKHFTKPASKPHFFVTSSGVGSAHKIGDAHSRRAAPLPMGTSATKP